MIKPTQLFFSVVVACFLLNAGPSFAIDIGDSAPEFKLSNIDGTELNFSEFADKIVVLEWFNKGCPFVRKHYRNHDMQALQNEFSKKGIVWLSINSTAKGHYDYETPEKAQKTAEAYKMKGTKLLLDSAGDVGKLYGAKTTPHMFILNKGTLVYQGAIDDRPEVDADPKKAHNYVRATLGEVLTGTAVSQAETKPYGCSVKYAN